MHTQGSSKDSTPEKPIESFFVSSPVRFPSLQSKPSSSPSLLLDIRTNRAQGVWCDPFEVAFAVSELFS